MFIISIRLHFTQLCYLWLISPAFGRILVLLNSRLPPKMRIIIKLRTLILKLLASILTSVITFLFWILKILTLVPFPRGSHLYRDLLYNISCCSVQVNLQHNLFLVVNSTLSLLSALIIANYCQNMLAIVEWTSHQTHAVFLNFVFPRFPQFSTYTPSWIVEVYLLLGYLGITTQLALTLDLIYIYNLPAIYMYKLLAFSYTKLLSLIKFCLQIIQYDHERWLTCPYSFLLHRPRNSKILAITALLILGQILLIVVFYYLWLTLVILMLVLSMNFILNLIEATRKISEIMLVIKGYTIEVIENDLIDESLKKREGIRNKINQFKEINFNWTPLIKLHDIKDVFLGKDIVQPSPVSFSFNKHLKFSIKAVYQSFLSLARQN